jgi:hypothetical protein
MAKDPHRWVYPHGYTVIAEVCLTDREYSEFRNHNHLEDRRMWREQATADGGRRLRRAGSVALTGRRPRNDNLGLARQNREWGTRLYGITIEDRGDDADECRRLGVLLSGVRDGNIATGLRHLGLKPRDWAIAGWRQIEHYVVLSSPQARRLSRLLRGEYVRAIRGPYCRKEYLLRDFPVPVLVRTRTKATAYLNVYRIVGGATCDWRVEISLRADAHRHLVFDAADSDMLRQTLIDLVIEHDLHPLPKPSRWEPDDPADNLREPAGQKLWATTYRGPKTDVQPTSKLRGSEDVRWVEPRPTTPSSGHAGIPAGVSDPNSRGTTSHDEVEDVFTSPDHRDLPLADDQAPSLIDSLSSTALGGIEEHVDLDALREQEAILYEMFGMTMRTMLDRLSRRSSWPPCSHPTCLCQFRFPPRDEPDRPAGPRWVSVLSAEVDSLPEGYLVEITGNANMGPRRVLDGLVSHFGDRMAIRYLGDPSEMDLSVVEHMATMVSVAEPEVVVVVVDETVPGGLLTACLDRWRDLLESEVHGTGRKVILLTADLGGAGKNIVSSAVEGATYSCHQRYRVRAAATWAVVQIDVIKDERHGRHGRRRWRLGEHEGVAVPFERTGLGGEPEDEAEGQQAEPVAEDTDEDDEDVDAWE